MPPIEPARLSVVIVTFDSQEALRGGLPPLVAQLGARDELILVDNASRDGTLEVARELAPRALILPQAHNTGFAAAANAGVRRAAGELVVLLNPDARIADDFCAEIRRPLTDGRGWDAWMGLVTAESGRIVNTSGGVVHFTGIAWAGAAGAPVPPGPVPREVGFVSGACLAVPRTRFIELGGFSKDYFMYHEDVDLSLRIRLHGGRIGVQPAARVDHDYAFDKGAAKWRLVERNRWATILRTYPAELLLMLAPGLLLTEAALVLAAAAGGWLPQKIAAMVDVARALPRLRLERREIQATRQISAAAFAEGLVAELSSRYLGRAARMAPLRWALGAYWSAACRALRVIERS